MRSAVSSISPSASMRFFPISKIIHAASSNRRARMPSAAFRRSAARVSQGVRLQDAKAARAAATAACTSAIVAFATRATTMRVSVGLRLSV
jgi:hypothetical protein